MSSISLSIIIVNYKAPQLILDCLQSICQQPAQANHEIIIVDNFSQDESEKILTSAFSQVKWIQIGYNSGFARANNAGIKAAKGNVVLLLNSDTFIEDSAITHAYESFITSEYVACSVQLLNADGSPQISGNYFMKGGLNHLLPLPYTGRMLKAIANLFKVKKTNVPEAKGTVEVDWINGAFLMVKKSAIEKAGMLDEDFFLYAEEIEWCGRLRKIGKMCIYGDLHVVHLQGVTANKTFDSAAQGYFNLSDRKGFQLMLSGLVRIRKQFGIGWFLFHLMAHLLTIPVYFIIALFKMIVFKPEWKNWWGFTKNVGSVCRYLFTIIRNKPHFYKVL